MTLAQAIEQFLAHCRYEKNLSPKTLKAYSIDLRQFSEVVGRLGLPTIGEIDKAVLRSYVKGLFDGLAEKSVKRKVATLKVLFHFLEREDLLTVNPFRKMEVRIKETRRLPRVISLSDLRQLFSHLYHLKEGAQDTTSFAYRTLLCDIAVIEVLFATGARVAEVCTLKVADVDLPGGSLRILGKGARERTLDLCHRETLAVLQEHFSSQPEAMEPDRPFFQNRRGGRLTEQSVRALLRKHAKRAGLPNPVTPHMLRHSVATLLLEEGVDIRFIQRVLGHTSIATTQIYTEVRDHQRRQVLQAKHPRRLLEVAGDKE